MKKTDKKWLKKDLVLHHLKRGAYTEKSDVFQRVEKSLEKLTIDELDSLGVILSTIN